MSARTPTSRAYWAALAEGMRRTALSISAMVEGDCVGQCEPPGGRGKSVKSWESVMSTGRRPETEALALPGLKHYTAA